MIESAPIIITAADCCQQDFGLRRGDDLYSPYSVHILEDIIEVQEHSLTARLPCDQQTGTVHHSFFANLNKAAACATTEQLEIHLASIITKTRPLDLGLGTRSLTASYPLGHNAIMTFATQAPGSPPELSGSKSSKSSSFRSSSFSGADGILNDLSHFEEIGLEDDPQQLNQEFFGLDYTQRQSPRMAAVNTNGSKHTTTVGVRELTNGARRPVYPSLQGQVKYATSHDTRLSLNLPNGNAAKKRLTSPSTPSLAMTAMRNRSRSRSPSPTNPHMCPTSPRSVTNGTPQMRSAPLLIPKRPSSRRGSWQPSKKTARELEEEYHDSDEDLPDDTSLWNVPLSPREYKTSISATSSANVSASTSPERPSNLSVSLGMTPLRHLHTAPADVQSMYGTSASIPSSPMKPSMSRGSSTGMMPDHFGFPKTRTKSWTVVLSELSEEAKSLTEALEEHAIETDRQHEEKIQNGVASVRPSLEKLSRSKTTGMELPPLRKSNIMIDPLPISKEKEKVLSRTRPSWLPPKSQKEEKRHLKQYQKMMELSLEAGKGVTLESTVVSADCLSEKKKTAKAASQKCAHDDTKATLLRIWEEHVLPNWDQVIREPRTRELFWRGIAPRSRAQVWRRAIGNDLALTESTYAKALQRAKDVEKEIAMSKSDEVRKEKAWFDAIRRDIEATFPDLKMFQPGGPLHSALIDVLMAYTMYRSDVGYSHGTHVSSLYLRPMLLPSPQFTQLTLTRNSASRSAPPPSSPNVHIRIHVPSQPPQSTSSPRIPNR